MRYFCRREARNSLLGQIDAAPFVSSNDNTITAEEQYYNY